ncbi:MAG TPA: C4-dicarboxylate ABC transporter substrate-binding protein, partial [Bacillus sp. (in: firmicutes)]
MKSRKFLFLSGLFLVLAMIMAACGGNTNEETGGSIEKNNSESEAEKPEFISVLTGGTGGTY